MKVSVRARALMAVGALFVAACSGDDATSPNIKTVDSASGNGQTAVVGSALPQQLVVKAYTSHGDPLSGLPVTFTVGTGGGTLSAQTATTDANGEATVTWTLGTTAGTQAISANVEGIGGTVFTATATPSSPAVVQADSGNAQVAAAGTQLSTPLAVTVLDEFGNPVPDAVVTFTPAMDGVVSDDSVTTDESGMAIVKWTLGSTKGTQTVTAEVNGVTYVFSAVAN